MRTPPLLAQASAFGLLLLAVWAGLSVYQPPPARGADAPATEFSAARAQPDVARIARAPHPLGSAEHERVRTVLRQRLEGLGLRVEQQAAVGASAKYRSAGRVHNLLARLPGTASTGAVLLSAHYDSVPMGPGAADDASGVAAILEVLRALKAGPSLRNDVLVLFSDGEEFGLLGAEAFTRHPAFRDVALVLNVEARGHRGPAYLFETSAGNAALMRAAADSGAPLVANSLTYEVYQRLPNDTDFSVYKRAGKPGLNFAFLDGLTHYHTRQDSPERLDPGSLQHQGEYLLQLARRYGGQDLAALEHGEDGIYFAMPWGLVLYGQGFAWALGLAAAAALALAQGRARREGLSWTEQAHGLARVLGTAVLAGLAGQGLWWALKHLNPPYHWLSNKEAYGTAWLTWALLAGVLALVAALLYRRERVHGLAAGWLLALAALAATWALPGASPLLAWPALGLGLALALPERAWSLPARALLLAPIPLLILPFLPQLRIALTPALFGGIAALAAWYFAALAPALAPCWRRWPRLGMGLALAALALGGWALVASRFDADQAQPNHMMYLLERDPARAEPAQAWWLAAGTARDGWMRQFLGESPEAATAPLPYDWSPRVQRAAAPVLPLARPGYRVLADERAEGRRRLRLSLASEAPVLGLVLPDGWTLSLRDETGAQGPGSAPVQLLLGAPPQDWQLELAGPAEPPLRLGVLQQFYGLPTPETFPREPRGPAQMQAPFRQSDSRFTLDRLEL